MKKKTVPATSVRKEHMGPKAVRSIQSARLRLPVLLIALVTSHLIKLRFVFIGHAHDTWTFGEALAFVERRCKTGFNELYVQVTVHRDNLHINNQQDALSIQNFILSRKLEVPT